MFEKVLSWIATFAKGKGLNFIRMDTWTANPQIIEYYKGYGFVFLENYTTPNTHDLPEQHRNLTVALLEFEL